MERLSTDQTPLHCSAWTLSDERRGFPTQQFVWRVCKIWKIQAKCNLVSHAYFPFWDIFFPTFFSICILHIFPFLSIVAYLSLVLVALYIYKLYVISNMFYLLFKGYLQLSTRDQLCCHREAGDLSLGRLLPEAPLRQQHSPWHWQGRPHQAGAKAEENVECFGALKERDVDLK